MSFLYFVIWCRRGSLGYHCWRHDALITQMGLCLRCFYADEHGIVQVRQHQFDKLGRYSQYVFAIRVHFNASMHGQRGVCSNRSFDSSYDHRPVELDSLLIYLHLIVTTIPSIKEGIKFRKTPSTPPSPVDGLSGIILSRLCICLMLNASHFPPIFPVDLFWYRFPFDL
ncbi:hypothetical protein F4820DRAFT_231061 [Hypoxylon rubiginosum]|uniref:Uncharacterized protein n=1 Tax=Hypoxylon rubiginosum TaxID=110542 RepID=A0ACB9Z628_9PEZI|nr:hypothetical protein F4820DRAFT_231061 [Hypoxylon rubiginosum]